MAKRTNRVAWGLSLVLGVGLLGVGGMLGSWLRSYWIARYRGENADLRGATLIHAPLAGAQDAFYITDTRNVWGVTVRATGAIQVWATNVSPTSWERR